MMRHHNVQGCGGALIVAEHAPDRATVKHAIGDDRFRLSQYRGPGAFDRALAAAQAAVAPRNEQEADPPDAA